MRRYFVPFVGILCAGALVSSFFQLEGLIVEGITYGACGGLLIVLLYFIVTQQLETYVLKRLGEAAFTLFVIATMTFLLLRFLPGGPFDSDKALPAEVKANIDAKYGLNDPLHIQYFHYLNGLVHGDFGESYKYIGRNVGDIIKDTYPVSLQLGIFSLLLSYFLGIPMGLFAASKHNSWIDNAIMVTAVSFVAMPSFLVAPILIIIFSFKLDWFPPALWDGPEYYVLPVIVLGIRPAAYIARLTRASVLEVIQADFVRTARAKGVKETTVLFKHILKNSLIPVLTYSGPLVAGILSGTFIVETIHAIPGIGRHFVLSVTNRDYPLVLGLTLLFGANLVIANLIVDILYGVVDPRIRMKGK